MGVDLFCSIKDVLPLVYSNKDPLIKYDAYSRLSQTCKALFDILKSYRKDFIQEFKAMPLFAKGLLDLENPCWMALARRQVLSLKNWMNRTPSVSYPKTMSIKWNSFIACDQGLKVFNVADVVNRLNRCILHQTQWTAFPLPQRCFFPPFAVDGYLLFAHDGNVLVYDINEECLIHHLKIENGSGIKSIRDGQVFLRENHRVTGDYPLLVCSLENQALSKRVSLPNTLDIKFGQTHLFCIQSVNDKHQFSGIELKGLYDALDNNVAPTFIHGDLPLPIDYCILNVFPAGNDFIIVAKRDKFVRVYKASFLEDKMTFHLLSDNLPLSPFHFIGEHFYHEERLFVALVEYDLLTIRLYDLETGEYTALYSKKLKFLNTLSLNLNWFAAGPSQVHCHYGCATNWDVEIITFNYTR